MENSNLDTTLLNRLDLEAPSIIEMVLNSSLPVSFKTTEEWYNHLRSSVVDLHNNALKDYLEGLKLLEKYAAIETLEELQTQTVDYIPLEFKQELAKTVSNLADLFLHQQVWFYTHMLNAWTNSAREYCDQIIYARAQQIAQQQAKKKSRIILN